MKTIMQLTNVSKVYDVKSIKSDYACQMAKEYSFP